MRADRLVALLLLLQARGRLTAAEAAAELEVSERTARRDLEALGMAGLPVYSRQGFNGGWELLGSARTDLSGLTAGEARALFLVAGPSSAATPAVKSALRKLVRALPESFRAQAEAASSALVVDPTWWGRQAPQRPDPPHLDALQEAVVAGREVTLGYVSRAGEPSTRDVQPLGLASKGTAWYLVADTEAGMRTFKVERVTSVELTGRPAARPPDFDLARAWHMVTETVQTLKNPVRARGTAAAEMVHLLHFVFGTRIRIGPAEGDGGVAIEVAGSNEDALAGELAGFGARLEVLEPAAIRERLHRIGEELVGRYSPQT